MPMKFRCTACTARLHVPNRWAGTTVECPKCATRVVVPAAPPEHSGNPFEDRGIEKRIASLHQPPAFPETAALETAALDAADGTPGRPGGARTALPGAARLALAGLMGLAVGLTAGFAAGFWWRGP